MQIEGLRLRFQVPSEFVFHWQREDEDLRSRGRDMLTLGTDLLEAGLRLPVQGWARDVMNHYHLSPIQFSPNSWRLAFVFYIQCKKNDIEPTPHLLRSQFQLVKSVVSGPAIYHFKARPNGMKITFPGRYSNNKGWQQRVFYVERRGWTKEDLGFPLHLEIRDPEGWPTVEVDHQT